MSAGQDDAMTHARRANAEIAVIGLFVIAVFMVLHFAAYFFAPLLSAVVAGLLLGGLADRLERRGLPAEVSAALLLLATLLCFAIILVGFLRPLSTWVERVPVLWAELRMLSGSLEKPLADLASLRDEVRSIFGPGDTVVVTEEAGSGDVTTVVTTAPAIIGPVLIFVGAFYFFLAGRRELKQSIMRLFPKGAARIRVGRLIAAIESSVARYLAAITLINFLFGMVIAGTMAAWGLPQPVLWGALAFALNFIPYLGPAIMSVLLFGAAMISFYGIATPALVAASYLALNMLEGQFITPSILGRSTTINPFLVFCAFAFGLWFWGAIGAFLAMPVLLIVQTIVTAPRPSVEEVSDTDEVAERPPPVAAAPPQHP